MNEYNLTTLPRPFAIVGKVRQLQPVFLEGYRRSLAYQRYPDAELIMTSREELAFGGMFGPTNTRHFIEVSDGVVEYQSRPQTSPPSHGTVNGYYRRSDILGFRMPTAIPADTVGICPDQLRQRWPDSPPSDDVVIDEQARDATSSDITRITEAFEPPLEECDLIALNEALIRLDHSYTGISDLIDQHKPSHLKETADLFDAWNGDAAYHCYEVFGQYVEAAPGIQRQILQALHRAAALEAKAQAIVISELHNAAVMAHERIHELRLMDDDTYALAATLRLVGKVVMSRIPGVDEGAALVSWWYEISSKGQDTGKTDQWLDKAVQALTTPIEGVPTAEICTQVRDMLVDTAGQLHDELIERRRRYGQELETAQQDFTPRDSMYCTLIPGYLVT